MILDYNKILENYKNIFNGLERLPGKAKITVDTPPKGYQNRQVPRKVPVNVREELKQQQVIAKVNHPTEWCFNLVLVQRAKKLRICLDPVPMNKYIRQEEFHIPKLDEILPELNKAKVFSTCDAKSGFWKLTMKARYSPPFGSLTVISDGSECRLEYRMLPKYFSKP